MFLPNGLANFYKMTHCSFQEERKNLFYLRLDLKLGLDRVPEGPPDEGKDEEFFD